MKRPPRVAIAHGSQETASRLRTLPGQEVQRGPASRARVYSDLALSVSRNNGKQPSRPTSKIAGEFFPVTEAGGAAEARSQ